MTGDKKPIRSTNLLDKIKECIDNEKYILTKHALDRQKERSINLTETLYVLKNGYEEKKKTQFDKNKIHGNMLLEEKL